MFGNATFGGELFGGWPVAVVAGGGTTYEEGGALSAIGEITGGATVALGGSGALTGTGESDGAATVTLGGSGTMEGTGELTGNHTYSLAGGGTIESVGEIDGSTAITLIASGTLSGIGIVNGGPTTTTDTISAISPIESEITDAFAELLGDNEQEVFYMSGVEYPCLPSLNERGATVVIGGKETTVNLSLHVLNSVFEIRRPVTGRKIQFRGRDLRIQNVNEDPSGTYYVLQLVDANSGL